MPQPLCGENCQKTVASLLARIEGLTHERDAAIARVRELEDNYTELVNDHRQDFTRMRERIDQLERTNETSRGRLRRAGAVIATCLRSLADIIASR